MKPAFSICVYCGSRAGSSPDFTTLADSVGRWIGRQGGQLVYGGGNAGLMGVVAQSTLRAGGTVVGVIPQALVDRELAKTECTELHVVRNMHERKQLMAERAQAFVALPGGIGTLEEFFEVWTWRQLGYHDKPIGLLNAGGYFDALLAFISGAVQHDFMSPSLMDLVRVDSDPKALLEWLVDARTRTSQAGDYSEI